MNTHIEMHHVSRWVAESELGRVTSWVRSYSAVLRRLSLPEVSVSCGESRTMQVWRRGEQGQGEAVPMSLGAELPGAHKTNLLVKQVLVHARAMFPVSAGATGLSQEAFDKLLGTFRTFIDAPLPKRLQIASFEVFFAHLDCVLRSNPDFEPRGGRLSIKHASAAVKSIEEGDAPQESMERARELVSQVRQHQDRMTAQAKHFFLKESISVEDSSGSDVMHALRIYAWITGQTVHHALLA